MNSDVASAIWRAKVWLLVAVIAAGVGGYFASSSQPPRYSARAHLQIISGRQASGEFVGNDELLHLANVFVRVAKTRDVRTEATRESPELRDVIADVEVTSEPDVAVLTVSAVNGSPRRAASAANTYAAAVVDVIARQQDSVRRADVARLETRIDEVRTSTPTTTLPRETTVTVPNAEVEALQTKLAERLARSEDSVRVLETASAPTEPSSPQPVRDGVLAAVAVLAVGLLAVYVRAVTTDRFASAEDAARSLDLPVLGELPRARAGTPEEEEAFRGLRTSLDFGLRASERPAVLFTSAEPGSGKTHVTANLAMSFAGEGRRVVAVDSDLRRPALHTRLGVALEPGLGDLLGIDRGGLADLQVSEAELPPHSRRGGDLDVVAAGSGIPDPAAGLASPRMEHAVRVLRTSYDVTLLDSPPLLGAADALVLCRYAAAVVLVVDRRKDRRRSTERALGMLQSVDAPVLGLVFNGSSKRATYGYGNRVGSGRRGDERAARAKGSLPSAAADGGRSRGPRPVETLSTEQEPTGTSLP